MAEFRKNPVTVNAVQFRGDNWDELVRFCGGRHTSDGQMVKTFNPIGTYLLKEGTAVAELWVAANQSVLPIEEGEWVLRDKLGFYPCKDSVFQESYSPVEEELPLADYGLDDVRPFVTETLLYDDKSGRLAIITGDKRAVLTINTDGTVVGSLIDANEAGAVFAKSLQKGLQTLGSDKGLFLVSSDGGSITHHGVNYYKACDEFVAKAPGGAQSFCVKRVNHFGNEHEDLNGIKRRMGL